MIKFTDFSMKNIAAVFIIMVLLVGGGIFSATSLKVESMPDISFPVVVVQTQYLAPPKDVLDQITKPLEKTLANLEGLNNMTSTSSDNFSSIILELQQSKKPEEVKKDVESLVQNVRLPSSAERPKVMTFGFASEPTYYLAVYGENGMNQTELDKIYKDTIEPAFNSLKGIDHIDSIGNQTATLSIRLDLNALHTYGLTPQSVAQSIRAALMSMPAGSVDLDGNSQMVRVAGEFNTIYSLENLKLTTPKGDTLLLNQVSKVEAISESKYKARLDGKPAIGINLYKTKNANTVQFNDAADKLMEGWKTTLPNVKFHTVYNAATDIKHSIHGMLQEGSLGALLASIMILLFLRNLRMTLIVLISIPLSIVITLLFMSWLDISLNIMTLGGMAIAIGRVVDDSIVVIENIYSQLIKAQERHESVIRYATQQVASAITSSTIATAGVFAPIAFVSGVLGEVFRPFALTLVVALMSSLLVSVTVIPMLAKLMVLKQKKLDIHDENHIGKSQLMYKNALHWSLAHRGLTLLLAGLIFIGSIIGTVPFLATGFMPESESDRSMLFNLSMPRETSFETMDQKSKEIEAMMLEAKDAKGQPQFTYVEALIGFDMNNNSERFPYKTQIFTEVSANTNAKEALKQWQDKMLYEMPQGSKVNGILLGFNPGGGGADFQYNLKSDDQAYLKEASTIILEKLKTFPELSDVKDSLGDTKREIEVTVDQNKARRYNLSSAQVLESVSAWIRKEKLGDLRFDNVLYETKVELNPTDKDSVEKISRFLVKTPMGTDVALSEIAKVRQIDAPVSVQREMQSQVLRVTAKIDAKDKGGTVQKVTAELNKLELPPGVSREVKGISEDIEESFKQMFLAMGASIFIVYLIMVLAFGNASAPFAILFSLPLAAIGGLIGLLVTRESINITSLIGFLMLIGIVVTNAIVLIDRVQQLREEGKDVREALIEAGMTRLRPIIMTAGATIIAMSPLAFGLSKGALISKGLAVVVIGGLTTSTLLTLVVVPVVYDLIHSLQVRLKRLFTRKERAAQSKPAAAIQ